MGFIGAFHKIEKDGKLFFVYHHPKYHPIPQTQSPTSYGETPSHDHTLQPLFLCPNARYQKDCILWDSTTYPVISSPEYVFSARSASDHSVLPLLRCNNKNLMSMLGAIYAKPHILEQIIIFVNTVI
ncbi:hypothetical protein V5N11_010449 [Cardamine amara subsp. amara]|uniref:Uncharacterized protein n=1 Tax=Cardamine amara subsp. amara TaxID=228776 RepID=A0ABD1CAB9_CARAN